MSWFSVAKKFILGSPKTLDDIFDKDTGHLAKLGGWIGNWNFTDQEKANMNVDIAKGVQKFAVDTLSENTERSKARREIALLVIKFFLGLIFWGCLVYPFNPEWSKVILMVATSGSLGGLVAGVSLFFFGIHLQRSMKKD